MTEYKISKVSVEGWVTWGPETPTVSRRLLRFPDGTQVRVTGLDEVMAEFDSEGRQPNEETGEDILFRLEKNNNYIPSPARREYRNVILKEYRNYIEDQKDKSRLIEGVKDEPGKKDKWFCKPF